MPAAALPYVGAAIGIGGLYQSSKQSSAARKAITNAPKSGFTSSALTATPKGNIYDISRSPELTGTLRNISQGFGQQANDLSQLLAKVQPGMSDATNAAVAAIQNRRQEAIGNLRQNLARRRVLGSSFGADALSRANAEFAQQEAQARSSNILQEIAMSQNLINQQSQASINQFQGYLDQMNLEANIGTQLASGVTANLSANARALADLQAQSAQGYGAFSGQLLQPFFNAYNSKVEAALK